MEANATFFAHYAANVSAKSRLPAFTSLAGARVIGLLERLGDSCGLPEVITVDNGPEFAGRALGERAILRTFHRSLENR